MNEIDVADMRPSKFHQHMTRIVLPRPIAWVSTRSVVGIDNAAPFSYFTAVGSLPPTLLFCPSNRRDGTDKDTLANIVETGDFVVNVVSASLARQMTQTAAELSSDESELDLAGLTTAPSVRVSAPRIAETSAQIECRLRDVIRLGAGPGGANIVLGDVVYLHLDPNVLDADGFVDPGMLDAVGRLGGVSYCRTRDRFDLDPP